MTTSPIRTILITGSTDGIGKQTALELAKNAENHVIIHGRDETRCKKTAEAIEHMVGVKNKVDYVVADFAKMRDVKAMVADMEKRFPRLNVLLCNAGVIMPKRHLTYDGIEMTFQVNHLAHFFVATKLCGLLRRNVPSRVVVVSSICYNWYPIDWADLMGEKKYEKYLQYSRSKLMNHLFGFALARRFADDQQVAKGAMTCNVLEPGVVDTKLLHTGGYGGGSPVEQGAATPVYLAQSKEVDGVNGQYFSSTKKQIEAVAGSRDENAQERLWKISEEMCMNLGVW